MIRFRKQVYFLKNLNFALSLVAVGHLKNASLCILFKVLGIVNSVRLEHSEKAYLSISVTLSFIVTFFKFLQRERRFLQFCHPQ